MIVSTLTSSIAYELRYRLHRVPRFVIGLPSNGGAPWSTQYGLALLVNNKPKAER